MGRFANGYFDQYSDDPNGLHEAFSDIAETYIPSGQWTDEKQDQLEWAVVLIEAGEYDAFFSYLDLTYDDIQDFWDDFREAYAGSE